MCRGVKHVSRCELHDLHCVLFERLAESASSFPEMTDLDFISPAVQSEDAIVIVGKGITNPKLSPLSHCGITMRQNVPL